MLPKSPTLHPQALLLLLVLSLVSVEGMRKKGGKRRRGKQEPAGGGGGVECPGGDELECLRQNIPGEPGQDYPIHGPSILCKLNPRNPGCPGFGR